MNNNQENELEGIEGLDDIEDIEELEDKIRGSLLGRKMEESDAMKAKRKVQEAYRSSPEEAEKLVQEALDIYPECVDAYIYLGRVTQDTDESEKHFKKAIKLAKQRIDEELFEEEVGNFWKLTSTRPYMRAKSGYAELLRSIGKLEKAIEIYKELLKLNPDDNQGIRYIIQPPLLRADRLEEYEEVYESLPNKERPFNLYNRVLYSYKKYGGVEKSQKVLEKAIEANPYVMEYLCGEKEIPDRIPNGYSIGSEEEAIIYIHDTIFAWTENDDAIEWISKYWDQQKN